MSTVDGAALWAASTMRQTKDCCATCSFAGERRNFEDHDCRRRAPLAEHVEFHQDIRGWAPRFPIVKAGDWCGEFEPKA